jgi:predicted NBD/HSP70 family sugar kinase
LSGLEGVYLGLDLGGTFLKAAVYDPSADTKTVLGAYPIGDGMELFEVVGQIVQTLAEQKKTTIGIGLGLPGVLDYRHNLRFSPHRSELVGVDTKAGIAGVSGVWPLVDNDANCAAALEAHNDPNSSILVVNFGTGVGAGLAISGSVYKGANTSFGEIGHTGRFGSEVCACKRVGCFEAELYKLLDPASKPDGPDFEAASKFVGEVLFDYIRVLDPESLVLGGGLVYSSNGFFQMVSRRLESANSAYRSGYKLRIRKATGLEYSGAVGAALLSSGVVGYVRDTIDH